MATQQRCLDLSDPSAKDPCVAGAKAAGLAAAADAGLPTLPGVVVPVDESAPVVEAAAAALGAGVGRARLAAMTVQPDKLLVDELGDRSRRYPQPLIVRSSSPLEADGTWSGAFSSFHGVGADELGTAVRGCWGSAFQVGVLERAQHAGVDPHRLGLAVLVQPEIAPDIGGTARCRSDGSVQVTATRGPLEPLMAGHVEGESALVNGDGSTDAAGIAPELLAEVAALSRRVERVLDHQLIEWAAVDDQVHLLQSIRSPDLAPRLHVFPAEDEKSRNVDADGRGRRAISAQEGLALRVAALTQRYPGRLGYDLILPWAIALDAPTQPAHPTQAATGADPLSLLAATRDLASELTSRVWRRPPRGAAAEADRILRQLRGDRPETVLETIRRLPSPNPQTAARILADLDCLRRIAIERGVVGADAFWRLEPDALARALRDGVAPEPSRLGVDTWEPFAHQVVMASGAVTSGTPAAPGIGVGRPYVFDPTGRTPLPTGRTVLVAKQPIPALAPLLWNAAALVTRAGSTAAHLIEFAHSIGVPTVIGCDLPPLDKTDGDTLIAVDGNRGRVAVAWPP
jgi:phosphohistidine swiveling domain-containing protein